jgi:hypothetical protein
MTDRIRLPAMRGRGLSAVAISGIAAVAFVVPALAGGTSGKVTVARGTFPQHSWSLAVQGRRHQRCYELFLRGETSAGATGTCRSDRHRPPLWSRLMGNSDENGTVELDVTRNRVRSMRMKIGHPKSDRPSEWIDVRNHRITRRQAHKAGVRRNFRFAVLHSRGNLCVKEFVLFNREGDRIKKQRVPCEF